MSKIVTLAGLSVMTLASFGVFLALDAKINKRSETMEQFLTKGFVFGITFGLLIYTGYYVYKNFLNKCTPSDAERTAAGGDGVLTFETDSSGNCVAATCNTVAGYTLSAGVCLLGAPTNQVTITKAMYQGICTAGGSTRGDGTLDMTKGLDVTERLQKAVDNSDDLSQLGCVNPPAGKCPTNANYPGNTSWWDNTDVGLGPQVCPSQYQFIVVEWTLNGVTKGPKKFNWGNPIDLVNA